MPVTTEKFSDRPYWRPCYAPPVSELLSEIPVKYLHVKSCTEDPSNEDFVKDYCEHFRTVYITECNRGEKTGTTNYGETEEVLQSSCSDFKDRNKKKTKNLSEAIVFLFGKNLIVGELDHVLSPELAKRVNGLIGHGLFEAGSYRKRSAKPRGYEYSYMEPECVEEEMISLFRKINSLTIDQNNWFEIAAYFLGTFLFIHPFPNGNGRTARLLTSVLVCKYSLIPVPLFNSGVGSTKDSNSVYLNCLDEIHTRKNYELLRSLIIECTHRTLNDFINTSNDFINAVVV